MSYTVYALKDPQTDAIRYVGATQLPLHLRLTQHLRDIYSEEQTSPRVKWLRKLNAHGLEAVICKVAIADTGDPQEAGDQEQAWIDHFKELGCDLLNVGVGGIGLSPRGGPSQWALDRLGKMPDTVIAEHEGKCSCTVMKWRQKQDIPRYLGPRIDDLPKQTSIQALRLETPKDTYDSLLFPTRVKKFVLAMMKEYSSLDWKITPTFLDRMMNFVQSEKAVVEGNPEEEFIVERLDELLEELRAQRERLLED